MTATVTELVTTGVPPAVAQILTITGATGLTATGTVQGDALALTAEINIITTAALNTGVRLPNTRNSVNNQAKHLVMVRNSGANALNVYPATGETINALSANTAVSLAAGTGRFFYTLGNGNWVG
jgi:hypothetical protein